MYASPPEFRLTMIASVVAIACMATACGGANTPESTVAAATPATAVAPAVGSEEAVQGLIQTVSVDTATIVAAANVATVEIAPIAAEEVPPVAEAAPNTPAPAPAPVVGATQESAASEANSSYVTVAAAPVVEADKAIAAKAAAVAAPTMLSASGLSTARAMSTCGAADASDFIDSAMWALRRLTPRDCTILLDNPPSFTWTQPKDRDTATPWTLAVLNSAGSPVISQALASPRFTATAALPLGKYTWTVSYRTTGGATKTSSARSFEIDATTSASPAPTPSKLVELAVGKASPRLLPRGLTWATVLERSRAADGGTMYTQLLKYGDRALTIAQPGSPESQARTSFATDAEYATWLRSLMSLTSDELRYVEALAYAWRFSGDAKYLAGAKQRLLNLANWDPQGGSSETSQPQANRNIYVALATGFDLIGSQLTSAERTKVASAFTQRVTTALAGLDKLDAAPYLSFENTTIHYATQALVLVAGLPDFPTAAAGLEKVWPFYLAQFQAWGEDDGGYASSTAYAWYDMYVQPRSMATLLLATDVDIAQRGFAKRNGDFLIAATAPNQPGLNSFGDGIEEDRLYKSYTADAYRLYAALTRQPQHEWYWRQRPENIGVLGYLSPMHMMLQGRNPTAVLPVTPKRNDWFFDSVGTAMMHDTVSSPTRSSVHFRSSRFGSYNHGHADQNSFTYTSGGVNLLINSGYYPYYGSPHHANVTRATRYKNAITFDGGIGQAESLPDPTSPTRPISSMEPRGKLINTYSATGVGIVTGDATAAYVGWNANTATWAPLLTTAIRTVAYLKDQGVVVVYDQLASGKPRRWELNYHGLSAFSQSGGTITARNGTASACIDHYGLPGSASLSSGFDIAPESARPTQYHARYTALSASNAATVVTVIRDSCRTITPKITITGAAATVTIGTRTVSFDGKAVGVTQ